MKKIILILLWSSSLLSMQKTLDTIGSIFTVFMGNASFKNLYFLNMKVGETRLMRAVSLGNLQFVQDELRALGVHATEQAERALTIAAREGNLEVFKELLRVPAINVNSADDFGATALMYAAYLGHVSIVKELLRCNHIDINKRSFTGFTALIAAAHRGRTSIVKKLLKIPHIQANDFNHHEFTALMSAVEKGHFETVREMLKDPRTSVNFVTRWGTALIVAASEGRVEIVKELLRVSGCQVNIKDALGYSALRRALEGGHAHVVKALLHAPDIDLHEVRHVLQEAIAHERMDIAPVIWAFGMKEQEQNLSPQMHIAKAQGLTIYNDIWHSIKSGDLNLLICLLDQGYSLMVKDAQNNTPLHSAVRNYQPILFLVLINYYAPWLREQNTQEDNPLDLIYGLYADDDAEWNEVLSRLPQEFNETKEEALKKWQSFKGKAFKEGHEGFHAMDLAQD